MMFTPAVMYAYWARNVWSTTSLDLVRLKNLCHETRLYMSQKKADELTEIFMTSHVGVYLT